MMKRAKIVVRVAARPVKQGEREVVEAMRESAGATWHLFRTDPPQAETLIVMAARSRITGKRIYWAAKLRRDQVPYWRSCADLWWTEVRKMGEDGEAHPALVGR